MKTNKMGSNGFIASHAIKALYYHHHMSSNKINKENIFRRIQDEP